MPDTFIHLKGVHNDEFCNDTVPNVYSQKFVVRHETPEELNKAFNNAMEGIFNMQGMIIVKDEDKPQSDANNLLFIPMHMIARIEFEIKQITGQYPNKTEGVLKQ